MSMSDRALETVTGMIESVRYRSEDTGFTIFYLTPAGHCGETFAVLGTLESVRRDMPLEVQGYFENNAKWGRQFRASVCQYVLPRTEDGIRRFLASGQIKGVGDGYAARLVEMFGCDVFRVIEEEPDRLRAIKGMGSKRIERIRASVLEQRSVKNLMVFLMGFGITATKANRIRTIYGEAAADVLRANPYRLIDDVPGVGFKSADAIAQQAGVAADAPMRIRAAISHVLAESSNKEGHTCLPFKEVVAKTEELLDLETDKIETQLRDELARERLLLADVPLANCVYRPAMFAAETTVAAQLRRLAASRVPRVCRDSPEIDAERIAQRLQICLAPEQKQAIEAVACAAVVVITGGPGTGKTTVVRSILELLHDAHQSVLLCAPTGRAAKRLSESCGTRASTIHRLLGLKADLTACFDEESPLPCDALIVDECSMLDIRLAATLLRALESGTRLILVGDADQLPSVGPGNFLADVIDSGRVPVVRLTRIFRQNTGSMISLGAKSINEGRWPRMPSFAIDEIDEDADLPELSFCVCDNEMLGFALSKLTDVIARRCKADPIKDIQVLAPSRKFAAGTEALNASLQSVFHPLHAEWADEELYHGALRRGSVIYGTGDKVMQITNNYEKGVFNGDVGTIASIDKAQESLVVQFDDQPVVYDFDELDELILSYACTIHKSQGSEYPFVIVVLSTSAAFMLNRRLVYTAVTRGKKGVCILGQRKALDMALRNILTRPRYSGLKYRLAGFTPEPESDLWP